MPSNISRERRHQRESNRYEEGEFRHCGLRSRGLTQGITNLEQGYQGYWMFRARDSTFGKQ